MEVALKLAIKASKKGDIPVGAVIVENNKIIAKAYNRKKVLNDVTAHAEMLAISRACKKKHSSYLNNCEIYVTLEPCMMCTSAILQSHIKKVHYILKSEQYGYLLNNSFNIEVEQQTDYFDEYKLLLSTFFKKMRNNT